MVCDTTVEVHDPVTANKNTFSPLIRSPAFLITVFPVVRGLVGSSPSKRQ